MGMMWFVWIPLLIVVIWLIVRQNNANSLLNKGKESPLEILKKRYAKGEITAEEYQQRKKVLEK